jgi:hypothetical protein
MSLDVLQYPVTWGAYLVWLTIWFLFQMLLKTWTK